VIERETLTLHLDFRTRLSEVLRRLRREGIPLQPYETWRSPLRQENEYALGRTAVGPRPSPERPMGGCVTWSNAWHSFHQYGLATDLVFWVGGRWSWEEPTKGFWDRMHAIAKDEGLTPLYNRKGQLIERAHVQLAGVRIEDLLMGRYPEHGGEVWADQLATYVHEWERAGRTGAPPIQIHRPEVLAEAS